MKRNLWILIGLGTAVRLVLAFATYGNRSDIGATAAVLNELIDGDPFGVYGQVHSGRVPQWPYPPGFFPLILLSGGLARLLPGHNDGWVHLWPILADAALALVVQRILAHRGQPERTQLLAVALVAAGPLFVTISGVAFQIDSVAVVPALAGAFFWDSRRTANRALVAGLLIGVAASVKTPLGLVVFALLPTARGPREAVVATAAAVAVPVALLVPFLIADARGVLDQVLSYRGVAGQGMLSAIANPRATEIWLTMTGWDDYHNNLDPFAPLLLAVIVAGVLALGLRHRPPALVLAGVLWLAVWAFGSGFFFQYLIWGLPFLLVSGRLREAAFLQVVGTVAAWVIGTGPHPENVLLLYRVLVYSLFALTLAMLVASVRSLRRA